MSTTIRAIYLWLLLQYFSVSRFPVIWNIDREGWGYWLKDVYWSISAHSKNMEGSVCDTGSMIIHKLTREAMNLAREESWKEEVGMIRVSGISQVGHRWKIRKVKLILLMWLDSTAHSKQINVSVIYFLANIYWAYSWI